MPLLSCCKSNRLAPMVITGRCIIILRSAFDQTNEIGYSPSLYYELLILYLQMHVCMLCVCVYQGWRNVLTTSPAKLDHEDYAIKCVGVRQLNFINIEILFLPLILKC